MINESEMLTIKTEEGKKIPVIDSREVAEMMGKTHSNLMKDIQGSKDGKTVGIIPTLTKSNFDLVNYFIESSYKDAKGEDRKCYLVTKMGCELLGNKQQGEKGILFSAKYVERFNQYEKKLKEIASNPTSIVSKDDVDKMVEEKVDKYLETKLLNPLEEKVNRLENLIGIRSKTVFDYTRYIKTKLGITRINEDYKSIKRILFYEYNIDKWEQLTYNDEVIDRIDELCGKYKLRKQRSLFKLFKNH